VSLPGGMLEHKFAEDTFDVRESERWYRSWEDQFCCEPRSANRSEDQFCCEPRSENSLLKLE
jgi:hypothetical protein